MYVVAVRTSDGTRDQCEKAVKAFLAAVRCFFCVSSVARLGPDRVRHVDLSGDGRRNERGPIFPQEIRQALSPPLRGLYPRALLPKAVYDLQLLI